MKIHGKQKTGALVISAVALGGALVGWSTRAEAAADCTVAALTALHVPGVTVATAAPQPGFCQVSGSVRTSGFGAPDGSADFQFNLPDKWNGKFLFIGVGGFAGLPSPAGAAPNPVDAAEALGLGFATGTTDEGHRDTMPAGAPSSTDGSWALISPGVPDRAKLTDYFFRATHEVTVAGKRFSAAFFGQHLKRAYYEGCSNGGRQAFVEATHFPEDFDGIIAGDPFLDIRSLLAGENFQKQQLSANGANFIPASTLPLIDAAVRANCDAADGVVDGLIQNPGKCAFDPASIGPTGTGLLTAGQVDTLRTYFSATRDEHGRVLYTGSAVSDLASPPGAISGADLWSTGFRSDPHPIVPGLPAVDFGAAEPWGGNGFGGPGFALAPIGYQFVDHGIQYIIERNPMFNLRNFDDESPIGVVGHEALELFDGRTEPGDGDVPAQLLRFIFQGRKMLIYHGFSDPALNAFRTINEYLAVSRLTGGIAELQEHVRLFLVPGMHHCGGGPGPNSFETLTALDNWVEHGVGPDSIIASHRTNGAVDRKMPLCKFPEQAQFSGAGNPISADGSGWSCTNNADLLQIGLNGKQAGEGQQNSPFGEQ